MVSTLHAFVVLRVCWTVGHRSFAFSLGVPKSGHQLACDGFCSSIFEPHITPVPVIQFTQL